MSAYKSLVVFTLVMFATIALQPTVSYAQSGSEQSDSGFFSNIFNRSDKPTKAAPLFLDKGGASASGNSRSSSQVKSFSSSSARNSNARSSSRGQYNRSKDGLSPMEAHYAEMHRRHVAAANKRERAAANDFMATLASMDVSSEEFEEREERAQSQNANERPRNSGRRQVYDTDKEGKESTSKPSRVFKF